MSPCAVALCAIASPDTTRPTTAISRVIVRTPPRSKMWRAVANNRNTPPKSTSAPAVLDRSMEIDSGPPGSTRNTVRATASAPGATARRMLRGSGIICSSIAPSAMTHQRSTRGVCDLSRSAGRQTSARTVQMTAGTTSVPGWMPPNAKTVHARTAPSAIGPPRSGRLRDVILPVVALVLVTVIAGIVVLIPIEVDAVQHDADAAHAAVLQRLERALRVHPAGHLRSDHEDEPHVPLRDDHCVGDRQHRRRIDYDPVERPVREVRDEGVHPLRREQL